MDGPNAFLKGPSLNGSNINKGLLSLGPGFLPWSSRHQKPISTLGPNFNQSHDGTFDAGPITLWEPIRNLDTQEPIRIRGFWNWSDFVITCTDWSDFVNLPFAYRVEVKAGCIPPRIATSPDLEVSAYTSSPCTVIHTSQFMNLCPN